MQKSYIHWPQARDESNSIQAQKPQIP
jgi:hypothetical protein